MSSSNYFNFAMQESSGEAYAVIKTTDTELQAQGRLLSSLLSLMIIIMMLLTLSFSFVIIQGDEHRER